MMQRPPLKFHVCVAGMTAGLPCGRVLAWEPMTMEQATRPPLACPDLRAGGVLDVGRGFILALRGVGLIFASARMRKLTLAVAVVTVLTLAGLAIGLWYLVPAALQWIWPPTDTWFVVGLRGLLGVAMYLALFILGANALPLTLAMPLIDPISQEVERMLGHKEAAGGVIRMAREIHVALLNTVLRVAILAAGYIVLVALLLLPGVKLLVPPLGFLWSAFWMAATYLDVPMARHLYGIRAELRVAWRRLPLMIGFGTGTGLMLAIPCLNALFVPVAVASATLLYQGLVAAGEVAEEESVR